MYQTHSSDPHLRRHNMHKCVTENHWVIACSIKHSPETKCPDGSPVRFAIGQVGTQQLLFPSGRERGTWARCWGSWSKSL